MNHYTVLGCGDNVISMLFEILSNQHNDRIYVDIVKNISMDAVRHPYKNSQIASREIDADKWKKKRNTKYLFGVADPDTKKIVHEYFSKRFNINHESFAVLIDKYSSVASTAEIKKGVIINPGVVIAPYTIVEKYAFINRNVSIGHHSTIGESALISPGVNIAGHCSIGNNVVVGMGTNIFERITIGENSIIGAGSLVTKDIPDNVVAYGTPAKVVRDLY